MPAAIRVIGPPMLNRLGEQVAPKALVKRCEVCGAENCPILYIRPGELTRCYCPAHDPGK